jgi:selenide,water dikinase
LTCISQFAAAAYSGLLPAVLAGQQPVTAMEIALEPLCRACGATLIVDDISAVNVRDRALVLSGGRTVRFDVLSIAVGSVPSFDGVDVAAASPLISIKPMQTFLPRLRDACLRLASTRRKGVRVVTVGGGAGGVEVTFCLPPFIEAVLGARAGLERVLVTAAPVVTGSGSGLGRRVERALERARIGVVSGRRVVAVHADAVQLDDGTEVPADVVLWATGAEPAPIVKTIDLPKDAAGFIATTGALHSTADESVFAVGDAGTQAATPAAKAGVYAVRQGPLHLDNLRRSLAGEPLRSFSPQATFLKLLNTGDGRAIGEWRNLSFEGRWCWRLKNRIDLDFVNRYKLPG